jgi:hypothetical protein
LGQPGREFGRHDGAFREPLTWLELDPHAIVRVKIDDQHVSPRRRSSGLTATPVGPRDHFFLCRKKFLNAAIVPGERIRSLKKCSS